MEISISWKLLERKAGSAVKSNDLFSQVRIHLVDVERGQIGNIICPFSQRRKME